MEPTTTETEMNSLSDLMYSWIYVCMYRGDSDCVSSVFVCIKRYNCNNNNMLHNNISIKLIKLFINSQNNWIWNPLHHLINFTNLLQMGLNRRVIYRNARSISPYSWPVENSICNESCIANNWHGANWSVFVSHLSNAANIPHEPISSSPYIGMDISKLH